MTRGIHPQARRSGSGRRYKPSSVPWSPFEVERAMALYDDDVDEEEIAEILSRSVPSTKGRIAYEIRQRLIASGDVKVGRATPEQIDERDRRREGYDARDLTSTLFGDPPRGFSALDRQRSRSID